jgi:hypothetical protein
MRTRVGSDCVDGDDGIGQNVVIGLFLREMPCASLTPASPSYNISRCWSEILRRAK